jgi:hypothetical protein
MAMKSPSLLLNLLPHCGVALLCNAARRDASVLSQKLVKGPQAADARGPGPPMIFEIANYLRSFGEV